MTAPTMPTESGSRASRRLGLGPSAERPKVNWYGWLILARVLTLVVGSIALVATVFGSGIEWLIGAVLLLGWSAYRVQFVLHDASHRSLFRSAALNDRVGTLAGLLVGVHFARYRFTHMRHHRRNGLDDDPQLPDYLGGTNPRRRDLARFVVEPLWGGRLLSYLRREIGSAPEATEAAPRASWSWWVALAAVQIAIVAALTRLGARPEFAVTYYLGMITVSLFLARLRTLAEHQQIGDPRADFSRSHPFRLLDWLLLYEASFNYHLEHHRYPGMQSRHLRRVHREETAAHHDDVSWGSSMLVTIWRSYRSLPR